MLAANLILVWLVVASQSSHAYLLWVNCAPNDNILLYEDSVLATGVDFDQANKNAQIICGHKKFRIKLQCANSGWFAVVRTGSSGPVGHACGVRPTKKYPDPKARAWELAREDCFDKSPKGAECKTGRTGYDSGKSKTATSTTATMGSDQDEHKKPPAP